MSIDLTGVWDGTFMQPGVGLITFTASLVETGGALAGRVTEPCMMPVCPISTHNAAIAGHRTGSAVTFVKRYEPPGFGYASVTYDGAVNAEATEIDGRWHLPGASGQFLMIRASRTAEAITTERRAKAPAR